MLIVEEKGEKFQVAFPEQLLEFAVYFVRILRQSDQIEKKPSVRATLGLYERAQANAIIRKSGDVAFQDVERAMISVLAHRMRLKPSVKYVKSNEEFIREQLKKVSREIGDLSEKEGDVP